MSDDTSLHYNTLIFFNIIISSKTALMLVSDVHRKTYSYVLSSVIYIYIYIYIYVYIYIYIYIYFINISIN